MIGAILMVPGIGNSGPRHWQTLWQAAHPHWRRVPQRDWNRPVCAEWVAALDTAISECAAPPLLIAHSIGCLVVAAWAQSSVRSSQRASAAFLVAVPDPYGPQFPATALGFGNLALVPLGFPSLVVASQDDPFGSLDYARRCAAAWGGGFVDIGAAGHINAESGYGPWPEGLSLVEQLTL